ncbi:hypothetical protein GF385_00430 [Candidatus Dependentiae bacterium]|nr:hypothetical protein [Candidatus Dependentiae bacterium]
MNFAETFKDSIHGILHGFDRIIIKGHIPHFYYGNNFYYFLDQEGIKLKCFKDYVIRVTDSIKKDLESIITESGCYKEYLRKSDVSKEGIAKRVMEEKGIKEGLICALSAVEPCYALSIEYNKDTQKLEKNSQYRKCLHYYFYYMDRDFGFMHVKLQTWFPFNMQVYINGKSYLMQQLEKSGIKYESYDNSITWVEDIDRAQEISDKFHQKKWDAVLDIFAKRLNSYTPRIESIFGGHGYKWTIQESEYASDVLFGSLGKLQKYFPYFIEYASLCQMGTNIYTFFGRKLHGHCKGETVSDRKYFWNQGFRVKFALDKNFIKMYDKTNVLRVETTINNANAFKIRNPNKEGTKKWVPMRKATSNLYRYAEVAKACNLRYLNSLTSVNRNNELDRKIEKLCNRAEVKLLANKNSEPRKYAGFNLLSDFTCKVFNAILHGSFKIRGFKNKELRFLLVELGAYSRGELGNIKKLSGKISRLIAKLRAHKIVTKLPHTFRYRVTKTGEEIIARVLMFKKLDLKFC